MNRQCWHARNDIVRPGKYDDFSTPRSRSTSGSRERAKDNPGEKPSTPQTQDAQQNRDDLQRNRDDSQRTQEDLLGREGRIGIKRDTVADINSTGTETQPDEDL